MGGSARQPRWLSLGNGAAGLESTFLFHGSPDEEKAPRLARKCYQNAMSQAMKSEEFSGVFSAVGGKVGTATSVRRWGLSSSDADSRGRWKGAENCNRIVTGSYISPDQPFIDANVARA